MRVIEEAAKAAYVTFMSRLREESPEQIRSDWDSAGDLHRGRWIAAVEAALVVYTACKNELPELLEVLSVGKPPMTFDTDDLLRATQDALPEKEFLAVVKKAADNITFTPPLEVAEKPVEPLDPSTLSECVLHLDWSGPQTAPTPVCERRPSPQPIIVEPT